MKKASSQHCQSGRAIAFTTLLSILCFDKKKKTFGISYVILNQGKKYFNNLYEKNSLKHVVFMHYFKNILLSFRDDVG